MATAANSDGLGPTVLDVLDARTGDLEEVVDPVQASAYDDVHYYTGEDRAGL